MKKVTTTDVIDWAKLFLKQADEELTQEEVKEQKKYASLVQTPEYKTFLSKMLDESSQIRNNTILNRRVRELIKENGTPTFFNSFDQLLIKAYMLFGYWFPFIAMPIFKYKLREQTNKIIIAEERPKLTKHLKGRWQSRIGQNVNLLGEVVLGDGEADKRYEHYLEALAEPDINYISIKLSGIYAQIRALGYEQNMAELTELVSTVYREAMRHPYIDPDGKKRAKFVNLDMEEYKDTQLTMDIFIAVLSKPEFKNYEAGVVIQAYLPDAEHLQRRLLDFAKKRVAEGGAPLKMRLVKGANLQMESVISSAKGWENPVYPTKVEVDANYMHILDIALQPENIKAVRVGVASHNYFTIAYAHLLAEQNGVSEYVTFEMLEGMANNLPRVMRKLQKQIILYTPVVKADHFLNAISYLVRRLDENTGKDNFLSYTFNLKLDGPHWHFLAEQFEKAYALKDSVNVTPYRTQDRTQMVTYEPISDFFNEPDTDLELSQNRQWALDALKKWEAMRPEEFTIPVQIGDKEIKTEHKRAYKDRSKNDSVTFCEVYLSSMEHVKEIMTIAEQDASKWRATPLDKRTEILHKTAINIANKRGDLIGCMSAITGKTFTEGDVEVSEAIDFCRFYPLSMKTFEELPSVTYNAKGIVLVIPPWNFPLAIPVGGVAAALAGGNTVILKPATVAMPVAWEFAKCFWEAGVPKDALQVICTADRESLGYVTNHPAIKHTILTGGTDTAFRLLKSNPRTPLSAETGGKNVIIVTENGDQDHAILNIVASAFGNAGQKCSACSLLFLAKNIYNDESFKSKLKDAVYSMRTGSAWDPMTVVGPMIENTNEKLHHAIEELEPGESWLVAPEYVDEQKYILRPTVKWGVKPGSFTFENELFAPLLSVVCIDNLEQGIEYANRSEYGLTSGLQSLNEEEQLLWKNSIEAGNLYINRGITGAIVRRQPFGGMKRSAFGGGIKAGGSNYVSCFVNFEEKPVSDRLAYARESYYKAYMNEFSVERDVSHIYGEENIFRYLPLKNMGFRVRMNDTMEDIMMVCTAAHLCHTTIDISMPPQLEMLDELVQKTASLACLTIKQETDEEFVLQMDKYERIRTTTNELSDEFYHKAAELGKHIASDKPCVEGRIELLNYLKEQSVTTEYHRYGSIFDDTRMY
ncbi:aldehyde dehydrogenase family protein [Bacteroides sp. 214]|uniref:bifunctional proline dehydrogenase/L-glutamate gamma-semialdehyde dehydrogenase n=1 Tax=Bacteroides sp. 214 TaxID=2302935 RepID=UPI0013D43EBD|nr:bifunctional proline dehydrogenase/L-glutamate gamma-semialdehyde dehydrogenase [Bacteroides sp. 214]NDW13484.1 aldehyde dehydrogenase family protein [Bacteroides sp. 214]